MSELRPDTLLCAYSVGIFPMANDRHDREIFWVEPRRRGILPLAGFHVPKSLRKVIRRGLYEVTVDRDFAGVIRACAEPTPARPRTWLNDELIEAYCDLHAAGHAHSVEAWEGGALAGGLYGVSMGAAFFGESMFSRRRDASKVALVRLVERLEAGGFLLLDSQFMTDHLRQFGGIEIDRGLYRRLLRQALLANANFG
ncbi:MAG: leucyl/phenylalanyl-tRNA--protein transferase [Alphaproteobacteria bacterium]|jgi:leucyl/phenylalanyl-tRNA--protein transferase|nr:leucyl/phenylalanyl-tRNA--protein transferase [Alphaproteobacteria bacterium]